MRSGRGGARSGGARMRNGRDWNEKWEGLE